MSEEEKLTPTQIRERAGKLQQLADQREHFCRKAADFAHACEVAPLDEWDEAAESGSLKQDVQTITNRLSGLNI